MSSAPITLTHEIPHGGAVRPARTRGRVRNDRTRALLVAALCAVGMALTWTLAELVPAVHWRDAVLLYDFGRLSRPGVDTLANRLLHLLDPGWYTVWAALLVAVALLRRRPRVALAVAVVLPAAPGAAELLKPLLAHPHASAGWEWVGPASWPSGHATAATALALCAVLVAPRRLRAPVAALACGLVAAVACALLILAWHMPSDVVGGVLLATLCASLAVAVLGPAWDVPVPVRRRRGQSAEPPDTEPPGGA